MNDNKQCKTCRNAGEKLFLRGDRCYSPKCAVVRKPYPSGVHGKKKSNGRSMKRSISEYGLQLKEKQKLKSIYGFREKQLGNYIEKALSSSKLKKDQEEKKITTNDSLIQLIESRLDNVVFRAGFSVSRKQARQFINHGHILVDNKKLSIPSHLTKPGNNISFKTSSLNKNMLQNIDIKLKKHKYPNWMDLNKEKKEISIISNPVADDSQLGVNINSILEFYSR